MSIFTDILGTTKAFFRIGFAGPRLKNVSGNLAVRNSGDTADANVTAAEVDVSGDQIILNSDAASSAADWAYTLKRPAAGMASALALTLPPTAGTTGFVLQTDGAGNTSWVAAGSTAQCDTVHTTNLAFGSTSPVSMFNLPSNAVIDKIQVCVDTAFTGGTGASVSVGISGTASKYLSATDVDLTTAGVYEVHPGAVADGSVEALIATYAANGATAGAARILTHFSVPLNP